MTMAGVLFDAQLLARSSFINLKVDAGVPFWQTQVLQLVFHEFHFTITTCGWKSWSRNWEIIVIGRKPGSEGMPGIRIRPNTKNLHLTICSIFTLEISCVLAKTANWNVVEMRGYSHPEYRCTYLKFNTGIRRVFQHQQIGRRAKYEKKMLENEKHLLPENIFYSNEFLLCVSVGAKIQLGITLSQTRKIDLFLLCGWFSSLWDERWNKKYILMQAYEDCSSPNTVP